MISSYRSSCKWAENDEFFMILMNSTIVLPLQRDECVTAKETFNFKDYSHLDKQHLQGNHCIGMQHTYLSTLTIFYSILNQWLYINTEKNLIQFALDVIGIVVKKGTMDFFINKHNEEEIFLDFEITDTM